ASPSDGPVPAGAIRGRVHRCVSSLPSNQTHLDSPVRIAHSEFLPLWRIGVIWTALDSSVTPPSKVDAASRPPAVSSSPCRPAAVPGIARPARPPSNWARAAASEPPARWCVLRFLPVDKLLEEY